MGLKSSCGYDKTLVSVSSMQTLGLEGVRYFSSLMPLLLEMMGSPDKEVRQGAICAMAPLMQATWPRMKYHVKAIRSALSKVHRHTFSLPASVPAFLVPYLLCCLPETDYGVIKDIVQGTTDSCMGRCLCHLTTCEFVTPRAVGMS